MRLAPKTRNKQVTVYTYIHPYTAEENNPKSASTCNVNKKEKKNQLISTIDMSVESKSSRDYLDGLAQDCGNSSALALELMQSCTKPATWKSDISTYMYIFGSVVN